MASRSDTTVRFDEILINIGPKLGDQEMSSRQTGDQPRVREYDVFVYTNLAGYSGTVQRSSVPTNIGGLTLVAQESMRVRWHKYDEYLTLFHDEYKSGDTMRERLLETMSARLEQIFYGQHPKPLRVWWNCLSPELEELPWELLSLAPWRQTPLFLVRGVPGDLTPLVPLSRQLSLGIIGGASAPPELAALGGPDLQVRHFDGPLPDAIGSAIRGGCELVHIFSEAHTSLGFDSVLELDGKTLSPGHLHSYLVGSRTVIISFSLTREAAELRPRTTYSAYAHLGGGSSNTSLLAPVGPCKPQRLGEFWRDFYATIGTTLSVEDSLWKAQSKGGSAPFAPLPVALFLRQRLGHELTRRAQPDSAGQKEPQQLDAALKVSKDILLSMQKIQSEYGTNLFASKQFDEVKSNLEVLDSSLDTWRKPDGGME